MRCLMRSRRRRTAPAQENLYRRRGTYPCLMWPLDTSRENLFSVISPFMPGREAWVAIVGPTGAGKTTLINLLMRFYDVDSGQVRVDGRRVEDWTRSSLRKSYAMVLQDTWLFTGTVYENLAYGSTGVSREKVEEAARAAGIHSFISRLPDGYDTVLSEEGSNISKGQKQLLTIARAMLLDAGMLITRDLVQRGYPDRAADPGGHDPSDGGKDLLCHRPPSLHHTECRLDPGYGPRAGGGRGDA